MVILSLIKALSILPVFFYLGYMFGSNGFIYLIIGILGFIVYILIRMAAEGFPIKAVILLPLFFYLGFKFAVTGSFGYIFASVVAFLVYVGIKAMSSD